jgi:hypothetical protein
LGARTLQISYPGPRIVRSLASVSHLFSAAALAVFAQTDRPTSRTGAF